MTSHDTQVHLLSNLWKTNPSAHVPDCTHAPNTRGTRPELGDWKNCFVWSGFHSNVSQTLSAALRARDRSTMNTTQGGNCGCCWGCQACTRYKGTSQVVDMEEAARALNQLLLHLTLE